MGFLFSGKPVLGIPMNGLGIVGEVNDGQTVARKTVPFGRRSATRVHGYIWNWSLTSWVHPGFAKKMRIEMGNEKIKGKQ
ncbi:hypothetical protein SLEP1_g24183 [Rubroshorea leprosula]|uniref:Uncharacterized protein n=1 Tax=Rubroshorea leprosula TaxID=152421 RepID=A0AAV5JET0_9ROSI|nr:hypothetical protein SLEP1_g24183 [Rubroshorea leprosula]